MSLLDIVVGKYETPGRGALSALSAPGPLRAAKAAKAPRPKRSELRKAPSTTHLAATSTRRIDWSDSPLVQSVDNRSKRLRESPDELRREAEDDWDEVSNDPAQLVAFADSLAIVQIRASGGVPDTYMSVTTCQNCGPVPIWQGCPPRVKACPWCINGLIAPPIPSR